MSEEPESNLPVEAVTPRSLEEPYRVQEVALRAPTIVELWLRLLAGLLHYRPGQYVLLEGARHDIAPRWCSVANAARADGLISLLVTRVRGGQASTRVRVAHSR